MVGRAALVPREPSHSGRQGPEGEPHYAAVPRPAAHDAGGSMRFTWLSDVGPAIPKEAGLQRSPL
ncbi:hypothetical protein CBM2634_U350006 [Cupriavidus taiwanensis]|uniref:Uncharacterized protein n=1 Tax=Cupriavidus taiwanensis TaxID=164546 RepID=A0A375JCJ2_9BURK|nr:hypothetical protein CBM2634_U350006 [Cupriavidus taiwanensis]